MNDYTKRNIERILNSRFKKYPKVSGETADKLFKRESDWFPSHPYAVEIDGKKFCANIKIRRTNIHFHLVCGFDPTKEYPGSEGGFNSHLRHLIIRKHNVVVKKDGSKTRFIVTTVPDDWNRFWRYGESDKKHFWKKYEPAWEPYNWYVDWLVKSNRKRLQDKTGIKDYLNKRSEGEASVASALVKLGIRYVPEYYVDWLKGDNKGYRLIDFYLPKEDIFVEFNGGVEAERPTKRKEELKRYYEKSDVLQKNDIRVVVIYPKDLARVQDVLSKQISSLISSGVYSKKDSFFEEGKAISEMEKIIGELRERVSEMESKKLKNRFKQLVSKVKANIKNGS
jgi:hypothetical protein